MDTRLIVRYAIREVLGLAVMGVALFWAAGTVAWWPGWAALGVLLAWSLAMALVILRTNPSLLAERLGPRAGAKPWDTAIMSLLGLAQLARYILAGLDQRYGWTGGFPAGVQIAALVICALGYALFVWAAASNAFFTQIVRIQPERGHRVVTGGPYHYVRHPGYAGAILFELAISILFASWWSLLASIFCAVLLLLRTALEDRTLQVELAGYVDYTHRVRYRLLPGVW